MDGLLDAERRRYLKTLPKNRYQVRIATTQTMHAHCAARIAAATPSKTMLPIASRRSARGCEGILASSRGAEGGRGRAPRRAGRRVHSRRRHRAHSWCSAIRRWPPARRRCRSPRHRRVPTRGGCDRDGSEGGIGCGLLARRSGDDRVRQAQRHVHGAPPFLPRSTADYPAVRWTCSKRGTNPGGRPPHLVPASAGWSNGVNVGRRTSNRRDDARRVGREPMVRRPEAAARASRPRV